jgi:hypothetical protein
MATGEIQLDDVLFAAEACRGNVSEVSQRLGVTRWALQKYLKRTPRAIEAIIEWRERLVDLAEQKLWECVEEKQSWGNRRDGAMRGNEDRNLLKPWIFESATHQLISHGAGTRVRDSDR